MKKFLLPLWVFLGGQAALLIAFLLFPNLGTAETNLATDTAGMPFWGWTWITGTGVIRLLVFMALELGILYATFKAFMSVRDT